MTDLRRILNDGRLSDVIELLTGEKQAHCVPRPGIGRWFSEPFRDLLQPTIHASDAEGHSIAADRRCRPREQAEVDRGCCRPASESGRAADEVRQAERSVREPPRDYRRPVGVSLTVSD